MGGCEISGRGLILPNDSRLRGRSPGGLRPRHTRHVAGSQLNQARTHHGTRLLRDSPLHPVALLIIHLIRDRILEPAASCDQKQLRAIYYDARNLGDGSGELLSFDTLHGSAGIGWQSVRAKEAANCGPSSSGR